MCSSDTHKQVLRLSVIGITHTFLCLRSFSLHIMPALPDKLISATKSTPSLQRPFAEQRGGQRKRNLQCFGVILDALSGGDKASLLRDFFSSREGRVLLEQLGLEPKDTVTSGVMLDACGIK